MLRIEGLHVALLVPEERQRELVPEYCLPLAERFCIKGYLPRE